MDRRRPWFTIGMTVLMLGSIGIRSLRGGAKSPQANWDNLKGLAPGDDIRIVLNDKKSYKAKFQSVSDEAIVVRLATGEQDFHAAKRSAGLHERAIASRPECAHRPRCRCRCRGRCRCCFP